jgi:hypothetical protein
MAAQALRPTAGLEDSSKSARDDFRSQWSKISVV